jgi:hypothetical protein
MQQVMGITPLNVNKTQQTFRILTWQLQSINKTVKNTTHQSTLHCIPTERVKRTEPDRFTGEVSAAGLAKPYNRGEEGDVMISV